MEFGKTLKALRKSAGLTVDELANAIGKDRATVYRYENGDIRKLPFEILEPLSKVLKVTPADIINANEEPLILTSKEKQLILAYREQEDMQKSVDKLLGI